MTEPSAIVDIWTAIREYIPVKDRGPAAEHFLNTVGESSLVDIELHAREMFGACKDLDKALQSIAVDLDLCEDIDDYDEWEE